LWRAARPGEVDRFGVEDAIAGRAMCTVGLGVDNLADWSCTGPTGRAAAVEVRRKAPRTLEGRPAEVSGPRDGPDPERAGQAARPRRRMGAAPAKRRRGPRGFSSGGLS